MDYQKRIAYFAMEIGLEAAVPTYSGGLGVLAGDTLRSMADLRLPAVAVTLLHRKGYFVQSLDPDGTQHENSANWAIDQHTQRLTPKVSIHVEDREVHIACWQYLVRGVTGHEIPVFLLDTDLEENAEQDRALTDHLYGGEQKYRLIQEAVLGIGGVRMLRALGFTNLRKFHMNEGHAAMLTLELLHEQLTLRNKSTATTEDLDAVKKRCVFTTHTPVPAGHDQFPMEMVNAQLGRNQLFTHVGGAGGTLNMTHLALNLSHYTNGVARKHAEVSRAMFPGFTIDSVTNGVHAGTWTSRPFADLFDRHTPAWRRDNLDLRHAIQIPLVEIWQAHQSAKGALIERINNDNSNHVNTPMNVDTFTIGFARRAATYKRMDLLFNDIKRLQKIASDFGGLQLVFAGKSHPMDGGGKDMIKRVHAAMAQLGPTIRMAYLPNYDMALGAVITSGVDLWLNCPTRPMEASGTSGMKAALNGIPSLSILDGWWCEGCMEGITGWSISDETKPSNPNDAGPDASAMYEKLERAVLPLFNRRRDEYVEVMRNSIALNGCYFNTQRMVEEYVTKAYMA
ncbi:MAG TPA: alpha-glucan family phosphorylase [Phycisphaerales bacterium]|nr:alpha-glucan family phosphorylase [Phycisphaerales bacterium]